MSAPLAGKTVAILVTDGFEESELEAPRRALYEAGAATALIAPETTPPSDTVRAWDDDDFGHEFKVDLSMEQADPDRFDALFLPGGLKSPDLLRMNEKAVTFVRIFFATGKPIAAICHGPQLLIEAQIVAGRKVTSFPSLRRDLLNAGAEWVDEPVVVDRGLITSRTPEDIPAFVARMIEVFAREDRAIGM